ncbi:unnamed protein product [Spodoptera littoralis]|uniref:RRM domain-containing protein n=1 Tax=Spodoptera littoralis TaxID=7109 RepID=A0A9P0IA60_SPOLI|nr:unnamed protein product [Spodoptera littoralis]CAH1642970.1 unnamed protein product [Spodoptera littoralis]
MDDSTKTSPSITRQKRKRKSKTKFTASEQKSPKLDNSTELPVKPEKIAKIQTNTVGTKSQDDVKLLEASERFPILKDQGLVNKFLKVPMSNNQKGRIRQAIRDSLHGTSNILVPEIIHNKIQSILKGNANLTDSELRRVRILYNLLKTSLKEKEKKVDIKQKLKIEKEKVDKVKKETEDSPKAKEKEGKKDKGEKKEQLEKKVKGPKRYVVFLGNLPLDVDKDKIINHFSEMNEHIIDIRIPKQLPGKKKAIAYLELSNEPSYEFALSKHHSMLGNKRINVLYTAPKNAKQTKSGTKGKSAKLIALQKSGKLVGSIPLAKKRSQRRLKQKQAQAKLAAESA